MTNKYCVFNKAIYDGDQLVWEKDNKYLVTYENNTTYFLGKINNTDYGIDKQLENKKYTVVLGE